MFRVSPVVILMSVFVQLGCDAESSDSSVPALCIPENAFSGQPAARFVAGRTLYLPAVDAACADSSWSIRSAPDGNLNEIHVRSDGSFRFVPVVPGPYIFELGRTVQHTVQVVAAKDAPFEHYNYYQTRSLARVGSEIWVTAVYSPEVIRLSVQDLAEQGRLTVGPWPVAIAWHPGMTHAVVAQKADDTLGFIEVQTGRLVDAVWVGDEPTQVVVTEDGQTAYVALSTESAVAVVDVATRTVTRRIEVGPDPMAMALDETAGRLYVATHRSGSSDRFPFGQDARGDEEDVTIIDVSTHTVVGTLEAVGAVINDLQIDGDRLWVAATSNDTQISLTEGNSFRHEVMAFDTGSQMRIASANLSQQPSSQGPAVNLHAIARTSDRLWVVAESSNLVLGLDPITLEERERILVNGRPRALIADGERVIVHGAQGYRVDAVSTNGVEASAQLDGDPRSSELALGQAYFTGTGTGFGTNHGCNNCHLDALMDGNVWKAGPFDLWAPSRPFFWMEGTFPLGWEGYLSTADNFAVTVGSTINKNPDREETVGLAAYLSNIVPPPAANGHTLRNGQMTDAALRGQALFEGKARCAACHAGPLKTSRQVLSESTTEGLTDIPSLVGAYRFGFWLKTGEARTLREALDEMLEWTQVSVSDAEAEDLTAYLQQLTAREFFLLTSRPAADDGAVKTDGPIELTFSHPVWDDVANRARVTLVDRMGAAVEATVTIDRRKVTITPSLSLEPDQAYAIQVAEDLESFDERTLGTEATLSFRTAAVPGLRLEGEYAWQIDFPVFDFMQRRLDPSRTFEANVVLTATATPWGAMATVRMNEEVDVVAELVIAQDQLQWPSLPIPLGGTSFANAWPTTVTLIDADGDGLADSADGTFEISGPGFRADNVAFRLAKKDPEAPCEGTTGTHALTVERTAEAPVVSWTTAVPALSTYFTSRDATIPNGPGTVTGGTTYWAVLASSFMAGFSGPVRYGEVPAEARDNSVPNGAPAGGLAMPRGACVKVTVQYTDFSTSTALINW